MEMKRVREGERKREERKKGRKAGSKGGRNEDKKIKNFRKKKKGIVQGSK